MRRYQGGISFGPEPTAAELAAAFGLSRTGPGNYNGPCPLCSGDDRFHVHEVDGRAVVGCRGCIDGLAKPERRARYGEVMRLYRGDGQRTTRHAPAQAVGPGRPHGAADRIDLARKKWASAAPIPTDPEHPARRWLAARHLWRPDLQLPPSVRWLEASGGPSGGGLLAAFAPPGHGQPSGVQLVSVDGDGRPAPDRAGPTGLAMRSYRCCWPVERSLPGTVTAKRSSELSDRLFPYQAERERPLPRSRQVRARSQGSQALRTNGR